MSYNHNICNTYFINIFITYYRVKTASSINTLLWLFGGGGIEIKKFFNEIGNINVLTDDNEYHTSIVLRYCM